MGCWHPLREIVSKALGKCNGHERWREEDQRMNYAMAYPPGPPTETHYVRPRARTVTFSGTNSVHMIPPNPHGPQQQGPEPQHQQVPPPQHEPQSQQHQPEQPGQPAPEQGAPPQAEQSRQPKRGKKKPPRRVRFGPDQQPPPQQQQQEQQETQQQQEHRPNAGSAPGHQGHGPPAGPPGYFRYTPSPLPRWEATPRRHEYFSGEYRYSYPTPVREGIYSLATDANRLTTIFSEENPNACVIV